MRYGVLQSANFNSQIYWKWVIDHAPYLYLAQAVVKQQINNFVKFPPRQKVASFNLDSVMEALGPAMAREKAKEAKEASASVA